MRPTIRQIVDGLMPTADNAVVVDFETYYDAECSVAVLGNWAYTQHPKFDCYLVTIFGRGVDFVGHPAEAPWREIHGRTWVAHNAGFDSAMYDWCQRVNAAPKDVSPSCWVDTADMAPFFGYPRNLSGASSTMFGVSLDKGVRDVTMKEKYWHQFTSAEQDAVMAYAGDDAIAWCIYQKFYPTWPEFERALSQHTFLSARRGVGCDREQIDSDIQTLNTAEWRLKQSIPWLDDVDEKGKPYKLRSPRALQRECDRAGVPTPETTDIKKQEFLDWLDEYGDKVPAVSTLSKLRRVSRQLSVYKSMRARIKPDGRIDAGLKYYGAEATGRWAGVAGVNLQNFLKTPITLDSEFNWIDYSPTAAHRLDIRSCLTPAAGKKFIIADLSQIEPRVLNWIIGNREFLLNCAAGQSPYEAAARADGAWTKPESLKAAAKTDKSAASLYALYKARILSLGYQAGWRKFIDMAHGYVGDEVFRQIFEAPVSERDEADFIRYLQYLVDKMANRDARRDLRLINELLSGATVEDGITRTDLNTWVNSWLQVTAFRQANPLLTDKKTGLWSRLGSEFDGSMKDGLYELPLPSGRSLFYFDLSDVRGTTARRIRGGKPDRVYSGLITENFTQAIARDCFAHCILQLECAGMPIVFHVHDEAILEVDESVTVDDVLKVMRQVPAWAAGLPVDAEAEEAACYKK